MFDYEVISTFGIGSFRVVATGTQEQDLAEAARLNDGLTTNMYEVQKRSTGTVVGSGAKKKNQ